MEQSEMDILSRTQRHEEVHHIETVRNLLKANKPFSRIGGEVRSEQAEKEKFRTEIEGFVMPEAVEAIPKYLSRETTRTFYRELVELASNSTVVTKKQMGSITRKIITRFASKLPHRIQIWGLLERSHWYIAKNAGPASYPYQSVEQSKMDPKNPAVQSSLFTTEDGASFFANPDPHRRNVLDPEDPSMTPEEMRSGDQEKAAQWSLLQGIAARITNHKTGQRYPCWVWFSQIDQVS